MTSAGKDRGEVLVGGWGRGRGAKGRDIEQFSCPFHRCRPCLNRAQIGRKSMYPQVWPILPIKHPGIYPVHHPLRHFPSLSPIFSRLWNKSAFIHFDPPSEPCSNSSQKNHLFKSQSDYVPSSQSPHISYCSRIILTKCPRPSTAGLYLLRVS